MEGVSGEPTEDPVKNGTCLTKVRHRRWLRLRSLPFSGPEGLGVARSNLLTGTFVLSGGGP